MKKFEINKIKNTCNSEIPTKEDFQTVHGVPLNKENLEGLLSEGKLLETNLSEGSEETFDHSYLGVIRDEDGNVVFIGEFKDGKQHGKGFEYLPSGSLMFEGDYENDYRNGKGTEFYFWEPLSGSVLYQGEYIDGGRHGKGTQYFEDGSRYEGDWEYNRRSGYGVIYHEDDSLDFEGYWKFGEPDGQGTQYWKNGSICYKGEFKVWSGRCGYGTLYCPDGSIFFRGEFVDGESVNSSEEQFVE